ncbi:MAG: FtsX-like permease family protein [Flavobacteriaceae bacterium]|nr:FtsX-like permease family protein [Flavobacteriaceae bacterium]
MNFPFYIAKRYLFSKSSKNAINIIARIAVTAAAVGSIALFIVLSGFSGLREFSLQFTNVFDADLKIYSYQGKSIVFPKELENKLASIKGIEAYTKTVEERVFIQYRGKNHVAKIKGIDQNFKNVVAVDSILFLNDWLVPNRDEVVVGLGISQKLSLGVLDYSNLLEIYVPKPGAGQILNPSDAFTKRKAVASGMYSVNEELDSEYVFSDIDYARSLLGMKTNEITSIEVKIASGSDEHLVRSDIKSIFNNNIRIKNRMEQNDSLYKMLNIENLFVYIFVSLIAAIAIFNITGTIIMIIIDKRNNIKTLVSLGLTLKEVRKIFFYNGLIMTSTGLFIGLFFGIIVIFFQQKFGFVPIAPNMPYPVKLEFMNVVIVLATILFLGGMASKIAATRVTKKLIA